MIKKHNKLLNFSTSIDANKTAGEVQAMLAAKGVKQVSIDYTNGEPQALTFSIEALNQLFHFRMLADVEGVFAAMKQNSSISRNLKTKQQAAKVAWRILKSWVEIEVARVEISGAKYEEGKIAYIEIFMSCIVTGNNQTMFERFRQDPMKMIGESNQKLLSDGNVIEGELES